MLRYTIEIVGWLAAALMLSAYLMLTMGRISGRSRLYQWLNVFAGAGFILNSGWNGAYPSAFINVVWVIIGVYGVLARPAAGSATAAQYLKPQGQTAATRPQGVAASNPRMRRAGLPRTVHGRVRPG